MARYDRLANLPLPALGSMFAGFAALADLAGRERDAELGRRLRLHFLALRPLLRRVRAGETVNAPSLAAQVERVREELGTLSARDPQRVSLAELLTALVDPDAATASRAALDLAERALVWGHVSAADSYAAAAAALASAADGTGSETSALRTQARCAAAAGRPLDGAQLAARAAILADEAGDRIGWGRAVVTEAALLRQAGKHAAAADRIAGIESAGTAAGDGDVVAIGAEAAARAALASGEAEDAAEHAWRGLSHATTTEARVRLVELLGDAFAAVGHSDAADHAYQLAAASATDGSERLRLTARRARSRAEQGDGDGYRTLSRSVPGVVMTAAARMELARGALAIGDLETARRHVTAAQHSARTLLQRDAGRAAAMLASEIEASDGRIIAVRVHTGPIAATAARIAEHVLNVGTLEPQK